MAAHPPPSSSSSRRPRTGDKSVGSFTIEDEIGKGSFATVYRGKHKSSGALVAIKSVNLVKLNKKLKDNLYCEIEILRCLHHPHIVALIDCRESASHIHLVMEYCELGDLSYFIKKRDKLADNPALKDMVRNYPIPPAGGLNEVIVRHFLKQLASALEYMKKQDFIHRDVKPQNLLILPSPQYTETATNPPLVMSAREKTLIPIVGLTSLPMLKIADFGFARALPETSLAETLCGSPLYMAPEILRYEKYDARADLWSVGTVLFEMAFGRPPFRAANHVDLLRKIEQGEDKIRFPKEAVVSSGMKELIMALLKRQPVDRIPFADFFGHRVVVEPIPGLVGEDRPSEIRQPTREDEASLARTSSTRSNRRYAAKTEPAPSSPREHQMPPSPRTRVAEPVRQLSGTSPRHIPQARPSSHEQKRPGMIAAATAPNAETLQGGRPSPRSFNSISRDQRRVPSRQSSTDDVPRQQQQGGSNREAIAEAEQAVRDAREYVLVEKRGVEVNALADEMAASPGLPGRRPSVTSRAGALARRATTQGPPVSATGAVPASLSRAVQIAQGKPRPEVVPQPQNSFGKSYGSPSTTSAIAKAINSATLRMFGVGFVPPLSGKGLSPPQLYSPFPLYPTPHGAVGLIGDGRPTGPIDEDQKVVNIIEEAATRSDVVYGFAEVKYKQLIPLAPSMDHGLGGASPNKPGDSIEEDEGLTVEAIVALSEEALVLYVKALSLLAKSMDIAGAWWSRKSRGEILTGGHARSEFSNTATGNRINSAVQWVRNRFNEVLEKAEFVRLKLIEAQKQLPEDHPGHPSNHTSASRLAGASSTDGVVLSTGVSAEKLMYDRALEMSRSAAISEIANEDLPGCEISYITAIRMLEAVLENDDETTPLRRRSSSLKEGKQSQQEGAGSTTGFFKVEDMQSVHKGNTSYPVIMIHYTLG
ncbi:Serine/threonine-protein kinase ATG1 [Lachnellula suecica]|uniref:Serine/threonine-protein kinase ATG1 n=1 Tax=Lachnellula suecica TaxID=602035 RepID=A0A8T9BZX7_9HELO|nr:Serine/threonine-protein kinase ATG1 [Lachnellula suecica]